MDLPQTSADIASYARARAFDPLPDVIAESEPREWFALPGQWELGVLHRLVREGFAACVDVGFAHTYGPIVPEVRFRATAPESARIAIRATGPIEPGPGAELRRSADGVHVLDVSGSWQIGVRTDGAVPAGFTLLDGPAPDAVEAAVGNAAWSPAGRADGTAATPPHEIRNPIHRLAMKREGEVYALPAEVLGRVVLRCEGEPSITAGESIEEASAGHGAEQHHDLERREDGSWASVHELGLRYLAVRGAAVSGVEVEARAFPIHRRGWFACSDDVLTDIWATSAYTIRQCAHGLLLDGIKRDRLPWMGDLALGGPASAFTFGDAAIVERGLIALGQNPSGYVNGIVDYSLWWLICTEAFRRYFDAERYIAEHADHVDRVLQRLWTETGEGGVLRPSPDGDAYDKPIFIDWGVDIDPSRESTALQMLWYWALTSAAAVLSSVGHSAAERWSRRAARLREVLCELAWDAEGDAWRDCLDAVPEFSPYPNLFAVLAGFEPSEGVARELLRGRPRTPFVTAFALEALAGTGHGETAVRRVREWWGSMLETGATTFWEEFDEPEAGPHAMYGRPFGKSLCHVWASGPARLLPEIVCGVRPESAAWSVFTVEPELGGLAWAGAVVPVPGGEIRVLATRERTEVAVPAGHTLRHGGDDHAGPRTVVFANAANRG